MSTKSERRKEKEEKEASKIVAGPMLYIAPLVAVLLASYTTGFFLVVFWLVNPAAVWLLYGVWQVAVTLPLYIFFGVAVEPWLILLQLIYSWVRGPITVKKNLGMIMLHLALIVVSVGGACLGGWNARIFGVPSTAILPTPILGTALANFQLHAVVSLMTFIIYLMIFYRAPDSYGAGLVFLALSLSGSYLLWNNERSLGSTVFFFAAITSHGGASTQMIFDVAAEGVALLVALLLNAALFHKFFAVGEVCRRMQGYAVSAFTVHDYNTGTYVPPAEEACMFPGTRVGDQLLSSRLLSAQKIFKNLEKQR
jgi:hypothetical protein